MKFILGLVIGGLIVWLVMRKLDSRLHGNDKRAVNPGQIEEKQKNLKKVMEMARAKGEIGNDEVEKALGISDRSATRYLEELESQVKLQQIGHTGEFIIYRPH